MSKITLSEARVPTKEEYEKAAEHLACLCGLYILQVTMKKHNCSLAEALEICVKNIKQKEAQ